MENHKRILGIIYCVSGVLLGLTALFLNVLFAMIFSFAAGQADQEDAAILELVGKILP
jgi:hypothetical protein